ncbi:MAG: hypothetical protein QNJ87_17800 [Gammaproteobacteria bacterium]|nr:hypothetical protein [Gammaproteobacteria bacterium]MDJ0873610.1 hypothetical protein [Gammaproteobacteria bacterium]MDJ0891714.1 hypothetical protein [Gammaproteobacteria bacterium]
MKNFKLVMIVTIISAMHGAVAQEMLTVDDHQYIVKRVQRNEVVLEAIGKGLKHCPTTCYTDRVQRSRIECRAPALIQGGTDGPPIDRRGNFTGPGNRWSITETHSILDISVYESGCEETRNETLIEVLGPAPRHFPGDRDIEDTQSPYDPPFSGFNCNDYPSEYDAATGEMVAVVIVDLLIQRAPLVCR